MANYYFSQTWVGLENGTVVNVIGGGTATIGTDAFAYGYDAYAAGLASGGTYGVDWGVKTCDVYVDDAYAAVAADTPIDLVLVNPNNPAQSYTATGALTKGVDALGSASHATAAECKTILNSAKSKVKANGVGAMIITNLGGTAGTPYAFGSLNSTSGFFADGQTIVVDGGTFSGSSTGAPISAGGNTVTVNDGTLVTHVTINSGYVSKLWGGGANGVIAETNVTLNGGSVGSLFGGGYSGTVTTANVYINGGQAGTTYGSAGNVATNVNITVRGVSGYSGKFVAIGAGTAQASRLTGDFNFTVIDSTLTNGLTTNQGGTASFGNYYAHIINSTAGTISNCNGYVTNGGNVRASVNSFVIHVDGATLNRVDGILVTMKDLGDETYNKRTIKVSAGSSGKNSTITTVVVMDLFEIDADACLTVVNLTAGTLTAVNAGITVDVTGYNMPGGMDKKVVFIGPTALTGEYKVVENGTTSSRYSLSVSGGTIFLVAPSALFSMLWAGLEEGTPVVTATGTAIIGDSAFATYEEAAATGKNAVSYDYYVNNTWVAGNDETIISPAGTFTATVADTATEGIIAYNDFAQAKSARNTYQGRYGTLNVIGGTYGSGDLSGTLFYSADGSELNVGMNVSDSTISTLYGYTGASTAVDNVVLNLDNVTVTGGTVEGSNVALNLISGVVRVNISGSTVSTIFGLGHANATSSSASEVSLSIDITLTDSISTDFVYFGGRGTGGTDVVNTTGYSRLTLTGSTIRGVKESAWGEKAQFNYQGGRFITLDDSLISSSVTIDNAGVNNIVLLNASTISSVALTSTYGDCGALNITVGGTGNSRISGTRTIRDIDTLTVNVANASFSVGASMTNNGAIYLNVDGLDLSGNDDRKAAIITTSGSYSGSGSINVTGESAANYYYTVESGTVYINIYKAYFSVAWSALDPGDVVNVDGGTAIIGTDAFGTYSDAVTAHPSYKIKSADIYCNSDFTPDASGNVTVDGYTTALNGTDAFDTLAAAATAYPGRLSTDGVLRILGGSYTINAASETISVTGAIANAGVISIDTDDLALGAGTSHTKLVLGASAGITNTGSITLTGTDVAKYYLTTEGGSIYVNARMTYFSAGWEGLAADTVVNVDGGTAVIGTNAFVTYSDAVTAVPDSFIYTGDIYCNSDWTDAATVSVYGYTTTVNGSDAKNDFVAARNAYSSRLATDGVLYFVGGTYSDDSGTGSGQTQILNGSKTIMQDVNATTIIAGASGGTVTNSTNIRVKGSSIGILSGGNRANTTVNNSITVAVESSTVSELRASGAGLGKADTTQTLNLTVTGSSIGTLHGGGQVYGADSMTTFTVTDSTVRYAGGAGSVNAATNYGNLTWNLSNVSFVKFLTNRGIDTSGNTKTCVVNGDVVINVYGGTTTVSTTFNLGDSSSNSTTLNIAADSLLAVSGASLAGASKIAITIDVDGFSFDPGVHRKAVLTGLNVASVGSITVTGTDAAKYKYTVSGNNLYLDERPTSYFSIGWTDLAEGSVVEVDGGTAIIGTDAFATYDEATGSYPKAVDSYFNYDWSGASAGDIVDVTTPGGTFTAKIGTDAYATLAAALNNVSSDGYVHIVGGTYTAAGRVGMEQKDVWITNTTFAGGDLCGVKASETTVNDGRVNVVIGEGADVNNYYVSRGQFTGNAVVTVRDGGHVGTLYGACTSVTFLSGTTTINVLNGGSAGAVYASASGTCSIDAYVNIENSYTGNIIGAGNAQASNRTGNLFVNISGSTVGSVRNGGTGFTDVTGGTQSYTLTNSKASDVSLNQGKVVNAGTVIVNISGCDFTQFSGPSVAGDDVTINISDSTTIYSITPINGGTFGALTETLSGSTIGNLYNVLSANASVASVNATLSNSRIVGGIQGITGGSTSVAGDVTTTYTNVIAPNIYGVAGGATIGGDYDITISGGSIGEFRFISNGTVTGETNLTITGGTTTIDTMLATYNSTADVVITADAVLSSAGSSWGFASFTLNGELHLTNAAYATLVTANGFTSVMSNATGSGSVTVGDLATDGVISSDGILYTYLLEQPVVYVNADWSDYETNHTRFTYQGHNLLGGVNAFTTDVAARAFAGADTEIVLIGFTAGTAYYGGGNIEVDGGSSTNNIYGGSLVSETGTVDADSSVTIKGGAYKGLIGGSRVAATATISGDAAIAMNSGSAQSVFGGHYISGTGNATVSGDTEAIVSGGSYTSFVCGGNIVANGGSVAMSGDSTLTITGGVFNGAVAGGSDSQGGTITTTSAHTSNLVISGGTFNRIFGGNVASRAEYANFSGVQETRIDMNGSTSILIDTSSNVVSISGDVVAGSYGAGQITGNTSVTFTGLGSNLDFTGKLVGDSQNAGAYNSLVTGTRSLTFDNFTGNFDANIRGIDSVTLSSGSNVTLATEWYLKYASEWNFGDGTSLNWTSGTNDFSGDTMNLTFNELDSDWTIFSGIKATTANFDDMSVSFNGGTILSYDEVLGGYSDGSYLLSVTSSGENATSESIIKLAKLA